MLSIVAIDDSTMLLEFLASSLEADGHQVFRALDAETALCIIAEQRVDLVLTDVNMKGTSGFDLTRKLRAAPETAGLPVVFVTGDESQNFRENYRSAGVNGWIRKPFEREQLLRLVNSFDC